MMKLSGGKKKTPQRVVIYGPEGIGKTTLASKFPSPVFIDVEQGSNHLDVIRTPVPTSWSMLLGIVNEFAKPGWHDRKTLVIDTADWAEMLCGKHVCAAHQITSINEPNSFGRGFLLLENEYAKLLDTLSLCQDRGNINTVILANAQMRKFEQPDEAGSYDRWELKLQKKVSALLKEWADMVLFTNYKTTVTDVDGKKKAAGGRRVIYTSHHPCWDAKNRHDLPDMFDMDYKNLAPHIPTAVAPVTTPDKPKSLELKKDVSAHNDTVAALNDGATAEKSMIEDAFENAPPPHLSPLFDLMQRDNVSTDDVLAAVYDRGYFPVDTPLENMPAEFVSGRLVAHWDKVLTVIQKLKA